MWVQSPSTVMSLPTYCSPSASTWSIFIDCADTLAVANIAIAIAAAIPKIRFIVLCFLDIFLVKDTYFLSKNYLFRIIFFRDFEAFKVLKVIVGVEAIEIFS